MSLSRLSLALWLGGCTAQALEPPGPPLGTARELEAASPNPPMREPMTGFPASRLPGVEGLRLSLPGDELGPAEDGPLPPAMPELWPSISGARHDDTLGERLEARLDDFPTSEVNLNGVALLTLGEMFGTPEEEFEDALCEPLNVLWSFDEDGEEWEARAMQFQYTFLDGPVRTWELTVSDPCLAALETTSPAEAVESEVCNGDEELGAFRDGSACRDCLDSPSSWSDCEADGSCEATVPYAWWWQPTDAEPIVIQTYFSYVAACAPQWYSVFLLVVRADDDPDPPEAYDADEWIGYCLPYWEPSLDTYYFGCNGETLAPGVDQHTLAEGQPMRLVSIHPSGGEEGAYFERPGFARRVWLSNGRRLEGFWAGEGLGQVSARFDQSGWGLPPLDPRPDATDPDDPQQTFARDYVAAYAMKTATRRNHAAVFYANHNRCTEDAWDGPDERGRYRCRYVEPSGTTLWNDDARKYWADLDQTMVHTIPMMTLLSTGLPDEDVPSGVAVWMASSPGYEKLEHWSYPRTFEPDLVPYDSVPEVVDDEGTGPLIGQTYRFGKDPEVDARVVMGAGYQRFHHPPGPSQ